MQVNKCNSTNANSNVNFKARLIRLPGDAGYIWPKQVENIEDSPWGALISYIRKENVTKSSTDGSDRSTGSSCVWEEAVEKVKRVVVKGREKEEISALVSKAENESGNVIILG